MPSASVSRGRLGNWKGDVHVRKYGTTVTRLTWREQLSKQGKLFQRKLKEFWAQAIASYNGNTKAIRSKVKALMSPPVVANASPFSADDCAKHFVDKVAKIRYC